MDNELIQTEHQVATHDDVISSEEMKEFFKWASGEVSEPPHVVQKMMNNLANKLAVGLGISIVNSIKRQNKLARFIEDLEEDLYDMNKVSMMDEENKREVYRMAKTAYGSLVENQRKFIAQNKDLSIASTDQQKLLSRIMALPPDKIKSIMEILDTANEQSQPEVDLG